MTFRQGLANGPWLALTISGCLSLVPGAARAQDAAQTSQGPMTLERVQSGFVVAPEFKVTTVDHRTSGMFGTYAGWLEDRTFLVGGGVYWLTNGGHDREMVYGGAVIGFLAHGDQRFGFGAKALIGGGEATLPDTVTVEVYPPVDPRGPQTRPSPPAPTLTTMVVRYHTSIFVAEPEANFVVNLSPHFRLTGGVGYRYVGAEHVQDSRVSGATGTIALQIGGS